MSELDRIFDPEYTATDLFTDRVPEHAAFAAALRHQHGDVVCGAARLGRRRRNNVLTYFGMGGIGKTSLSRRLERWARGELEDPGDWGAPPVLDRPVRTLRVDFHGSRTVDAVSVVLALRAACAARGRKFPAFDVGLAAWWSQARPGVALPDVRAVSGFDVRQQMVDTLGDVIEDAGGQFGVGPFTVRGALRIMEAVRSRRLRGRALRDCRPLAMLVQEAAHDPSPGVAASLAGLLSWDLENLGGDRRPLVVGFADAFEYVQGGDRVQEGLFQRIVHLTPAVLWVVTTRDRLNWDSTDEEGLLPAAGPHTWPGLCADADDDPRQHLVGNLSGQDVERFLSRASGSAGNPDLPADVITRIRDGAHGLPLYLDLSLTMARSRATAPLQAATFGGPLPQLVTSVFARIPAELRELARTASLVPRFNPELLAEASGSFLGAAERLCRQTLVTQDDHPLFPYRLHDAVRAAVGGESTAARGAWAPADRAERAAQLLEALHRRSNALLRQGSEADQLDVLELAATLCHAHGLTATWLSTALARLPGFALSAQRLPPPDLNSWIGQLSGLYEAWRNDRKSRERIAYLEDFLRLPLLEDIKDKARLRLAYQYRTGGDHARCLVLLRQALAENPSSDTLRYQVARTLHGLSDFSALAAHVSAYPLGESTGLRIHGDLAFDRGLIDEAVAGTAGRARYLREVGQHRIALENESTCLWRRALQGTARSEECDALLVQADRYGSRLLMRTALAAKAICLAGDTAAVHGLVAECQQLITAGAGFTGWREWTAGMVHALRTGDREEMDRLYAQWSQFDRGTTTNYRLVDRCFVFAGYPGRFAPVRIDPAEDASVVDERWHGHIEALAVGHSAR
ncbi:hypothetical protein ABT127_18660 [Streptomyces sp. NPDC001904]|uniref:hypothetical protein n=1 Tax=Streptomyces sp. NPDC001904 TaxID=3154531 RepID=UPI003328CE2D